MKKKAAEKMERREERETGDGVKRSRSVKKGWRLRQVR